jgi:hypothetical protein
MKKKKNHSNIIAINYMKNAFSKFLTLIYLPGRGPKGGTRKMEKCLINQLSLGFC